MDGRRFTPPDPNGFNCGKSAVYAGNFRNDNSRSYPRQHIRTLRSCIPGIVLHPCFLF